MPYGEKACVAEMSKKRNKGGMTDFFHESDFVLGSVTESLVADTALERLVTAINVKEAAPSRINNFKDKAKVENKKRTFNKVTANSSRSVATPEHLAPILHIGLDKVNQMIRFTTQRVICT